jgi:protocatechuate 3,4-dioxygenase beta subunit
MRPSRRDILAGLLAAPAAGLAARAEAPRLPATPACADADDAPTPAQTPAQTEGPYFTPRTPEKRDFAADAPDGRRITLGGYVLGTDCAPRPGALIELWHCDAAGVYDNAGYRLRGHVFADDAGRWWVETIVPGLYPGRTRHYHLKVKPPGGAILTTQLYFPGEPGNARDRIFDDRLLLTLGEDGGRATGRFDFVLA